MRLFRLSAAALFIVFSASIAELRAEDATIAIPVDSTLRIKTKFFDPTRCGKLAGRKFHFQVGDRKFASEAELDGRLASYPVEKAADGRGPAVTLPKNAGCEGNPLRFVQVGLRPGSKELPPAVVFKELRPEAGQPMVAKYIQHLGSTGACKATKIERLMLCSGSKTENGAKVPLMFFVVQDANGKVPTIGGIPNHAKCEERPDGMLCSVAVRLSTTVELSTGVEPMAITPASIAKIGAELEAAGRSYSLER